MIGTGSTPTAARRSRRRPQTLSEHRAELDGRRERERGVRLKAVACVRMMSRWGASLRDAATRLNISRSTLSDWRRGWTADRLAASPRGRRPSRLTRGMREVILFALKALGRRASVKWLKTLVPKAARAALKDLVRRVRYVWHRRGVRSIPRLCWLRPGAVWACDFTDPDAPLEGGFQKVFVVRDLASGIELCSLPVVEATAEVVEATLAGLFALHGAPLVVKFDNGSNLVAWGVLALLAAQRVLHLRSPAGMPSYNGSCEAGIGSLKALVAWIALRHGRGGSWSADDVEAARRLANATAAAPCAPGRTPGEVWAARTPISERERDELWALYRAEESRERAHREHPLAAQLGEYEQTSIDRVALGRALVEAQLLVFRWRRIRPPFSTRKRPNIS